MQTGTHAPREFEAAELDTLLALLKKEAEALTHAIPEATARQWEASVVPRPREDTSQRASGGIPNPTADTALDPRRLAVRETVVRAGSALRDAAVTVRGSRLALERAVARFDGEDLR